MPMNHVILICINWSNCAPYTFHILTPMKVAFLKTSRFPTRTLPVIARIVHQSHNSSSFRVLEIHVNKTQESRPYLIPAPRLIRFSKNRSDWKFAILPLVRPESLSIVVLAGVVPCGCLDVSERLPLITVFGQRKGIKGIHIRKPWSLGGALQLHVSDKGQFTACRK